MKRKARKGPSGCDTRGRLQVHGEGPSGCGTRGRLRLEVGIERGQAGMVTRLMSGHVLASCK